MKRDSTSYDKWYKDFNTFLKEGILEDHENQEQLLRLMRYGSSLVPDQTISLEEYVKSMKEGQKKIYYISGGGDLSQNPFMGPFKESDVPVLIVGNQLDEIVFQNIGSFKGKTFVNVESGYEEIAKDVGDKLKKQDQPGIPDEDVTPFCLWLKD